MFEFFKFVIKSIFFSWFLGQSISLLWLAVPFSVEDDLSCFQRHFIFFVIGYSLVLVYTGAVELYKTIAP